MTDDLWGPWVEHDGKGCPVPAGTCVQFVSEGYPGEMHEAIGVANNGKSWDWRYWCCIGENGIRISRIIRYRTRRYPAATLLIASASGKPVKEDA